MVIGRQAASNRIGIIVVVIVIVEKKNTINTPGMSKGVSEFTKQSVSGYPCGSIFKADLLFLCVLRFTWHLSRFEYNIHKIYTLSVHS